MSGAGSTSTVALVGNGGQGLLMHDVVAAFAEVLIAVDAEDVHTVSRVCVAGSLCFAHTGRRVR